MEEVSAFSRVCGTDQVFQSGLGSDGVVVVGGGHTASVPLAGLDGRCCPPQANSSNYTEVAFKVKGHDGVNGLVQ